MNSTSPSPVARLSSTINGSGSGRVARLLREFGLQDYIVLTYCVFLWVAALQGVPGRERDLCVQETTTALSFVVMGLVAVRGQFVRHALAAGLLYRLTITGVVQLSYFMLRRLLPVANPSSVDQELYQLDLALFGIEPAMAFDAWVTPATTEWFAFFYFGYFFLLAAHILPIVLLTRQRQLLGEFTFGLLVVFCVGHLLYMLVPGYGPFLAMADQFQNELPKGVWLNLVMAAVDSGGAQKDIFPSIHTAAPTFIALFSFRHRHRIPFRYTWLPVSFFALNIIGATMFLRWHYFIDVAAGLTLGATALWAAVRMTRFELTRRESQGLMESWPSMGRSSADDAA
jgi:hypothetical protein